MGIRLVVTRVRPDVTKNSKVSGRNRLGTTRICPVNLRMSLVSVWIRAVIAGKRKVITGKCMVTVEKDVVITWIRSVVALIWEGGGVGIAGFIRCRAIGC